MIKPYGIIYKKMLEELEACEKLNLSSLQKIEQCFKISLQALLQVEEKKDLRSLPPIRKILFFKNIRPAFISHVKYYQLLYYSTLFEPEEKEEARKYWLRELLRIKKITQENLEFYSYYKAGRTDLDEGYFSDCSESFQSFHKVGPMATLSPDLLLAELISLEKYEIHVERQLASLPVDFIE